MNDRSDFLQFLKNYLSDAQEDFQAANSALLSLEKDHSRTELLDEVFRVFHTLKSSSTMLEFSDIAELAHHSEDLLDLMRKDEVQVTQETIDVLFEVTDTLERMVRERAEKKIEPNADFRMRLPAGQAGIAELKQKIGKYTKTGSEFPARRTGALAGDRIPHSEIGAPPPQSSELRTPNSKLNLPAIEKIQTIRVRVDLLDSLFNIVGELIITKNRIDNLLSDTPNKELKSTLAAMHRFIGELQDNVSAARMVPVSEIFEKFPRMVRDLARERQKEMELSLEGRDIELDKAVLDAIGEPVLHLLRNAVDHGIETPEERKKSSKENRGMIRLAAKRAENHILIEVEDDGRGIDTAHIKEVALKKGFVKQEEAESLQEKDILNLLFHPEFSTAQEVTGLSGRGVGLYVVKTSARELGGTVEVATQIGKGTRFTMRLPLTTSIMQMLMVGLGEYLFGIPTDIVLETLEIKPKDIKEVQNDKMLILHNEVIPFFKLNEVLNIPRRQEQENLIAVIIKRGNKFMGLGVDAVLNQTENIVKPFDPIAQQFKGFSGGTILGDGQVALLLDIPTLFGFETLEGTINGWKKTSLRGTVGFFT